jgi:hypothetical protein
LGGRDWEDCGSRSAQAKSSYITPSYSIKAGQGDSPTYASISKIPEIKKS